MAAESKKNQRMIMLKSSDGKMFEVEEAVAMQSQTIRHMTEDNCANNGISLLNVTSEILAKVIEYCNKHIHASKHAAATDSSVVIASEDLKIWEANFVRVDQATLFDLIMAAHYLSIEGLLDLTYQRVAEMIKGKTPEEIRTIFKIKNDFSPEEEEDIRKESPWLFEGKI